MLTTDGADPSGEKLNRLVFWSNKNARNCPNGNGWEDAMKVLIKSVGWVAALVILILAGDFIRSAFFQDLTHLLPQRECQSRLRSLLDSIRDPGEVEFDPGMVPDDHRYELFTTGEELVATLPKPLVAVADAGLYHAKQMSFGFSVRYAVVITTNGCLLTWEGDEKDYATAIEDAKESTAGRDPAVFWDQALNTSGALRELNRYE
jgi:hypothetical protein